MKVRGKETLAYYDGPRVVVAEDGSGAAYIADHVSENHEDDLFLVVPTSAESLDLLYSGTIDLRDLLLADGAEGWFLGEPVRGSGFNCEFDLALEPQWTPISESDLLVQSGVILRCSGKSGQGAPADGADSLTPAQGARSAAAAG